MNRRTPAVWAAAALSALMMSACGGGASGTGAVPTPAPTPTPGPTGLAIVASGEMTVGSIKVNGTAYTPTATATILIDDRAATQAELKDGMTVILKGRRNDDGVTGSAERVEVRNEVRGTVDSVDASVSPPRVVVGGQTVLIDDRTRTGGATPVALQGRYVEVHGGRDDAGRIRATLIDDRTALPRADELRGVIGAPSPTGFTLGGVAVTLTAATAFLPTGTTSANLVAGQTVEVRGSFNAGNTFTATAVKIENLNDDRFFTPAAGEKLSIEARVANLAGTTAPFTFTLNGRTVQVTATTRFEGGLAADLANNVTVEAEGSLSGTTLVALVVKFRDNRTILTGRPSAVNATARTLTLFGRTVTVDDTTDLRTPLAQISANTTRVEMRGRLAASGAIVAERLEDAGNSGGGRDIIQARTEAKTTTSITLLGITVNLQGASSLQKADGSLFASLAEFLAAVVPSSGSTAGTMVKAKGTLASQSLLNGQEAEIEN